MIEILPDPGQRMTDAGCVRPGTRVRWHDARIHHGHVVQNWRQDRFLHVIEEAATRETALDLATTSVFNLGRNCQTPTTSS